MIGVDLFSGAGGMSVGAAAAGIDVVYALEADRNAAASFRRNHSATTVVDQDIRLVKELPNIRSSKPVVLFGGPPCQGFSTSNQKTRTASNPSNWLYREFMRFVAGIKPDYVIFENVKGIVETEKGAFLSAILEEFDRLGYATNHGVLSAQNYGVPQTRNRLFVIASRSTPVEMPTTTCATPVSVWQAIGDLPVLANGASTPTMDYPLAAHSDYSEALRRDVKQCQNCLVTNNAAYIVERYSHIPEGGNWENIPPHLMHNYKDSSRCHTGIYRRLKWHEPSVVIGNFRKNMLIHPSSDRGLSVREAARLQSFPDSFVFEGSIGQQQQQVGNAVPPLLAKAVFEQVMKSAGEAKHAA